MEIPVFIINGFLEAGKTTFIKDTLKSEDFNDGTRTLILACEEGEEEYDQAEMSLVTAAVEYIEDIEDVNPKMFSKLCDKYKAERIFVEYNGMWDLQAFVDKMPKFFQIVQVITLVNAETYDMYLANMMKVMMEQYKLAEMVIFNRCTKDSDRASYRRSVKAVNGRAQVYFESSDGSSNEINEVLPFDVDADKIELSDEDFGLWYMDAMENPQKYDGKEILTKAVVYKPKELWRNNEFAPGRFAMTCCVEDVRYIGFKCKLNEETKKTLEDYEDRDFIILVADCKNEFCKEYKGDGIVLYAKEIYPTERPKDDLVYFN